MAATPDVAGCTLDPDTTHVIATDRPGGTATVVFTPRRFGPNSITVTGVDKAGNRGPSTTYSFFVADNAPTVTCDSDSVLLGQQPPATAKRYCRSTRCPRRWRVTG